MRYLKWKFQKLKKSEKIVSKIKTKINKLGKD